MPASQNDDRRLVRDLEDLIRRLKAENDQLKSQVERLSHEGWVNEACGDDMWDL